MSKTQFFLAVMGTLGVMTGPVLMAQTIDESSRPGLEYIELTIEDALVDLKTSRTGRVTQIAVKPCPNCATRSFPVSDSFGLLHGREVLPNNVWSNWDNRLGTVFYDAETGAVTRVMYFRESGEDRL